MDMIVPNSIISTADNHMKRPPLQLSKNSLKQVQ